MLLSRLNVLLHMRYNSNFHAPTAPNGCLMKRACVHKYEPDGGPDDFICNKRKPCTGMAQDVLDYPGEWAELGVLGRWPLIAHSQSLDSRDAASTCPMAKMIPMGGTLRALRALQALQTPNAPHTETD